MTEIWWSILWSYHDGHHNEDNHGHRHQLYCKLILIQATAAAQRIGRLFGLVRYNHNEHPDDDDDDHLHRPHICHFSSTNVLLGSIFLHMTIFSPLIILLTLVTNMSVAFAIIMNTMMMIMLIVTNTIREHYTLYFYWYPKQLLIGMSILIVGKLTKNVRSYWTIWWWW